jgi:hypothetical protein
MSCRQAPEDRPGRGPPGPRLTADATGGSHEIPAFCLNERLGEFLVVATSESTRGRISECCNAEPVACSDSGHPRSPGPQSARPPTVLPVVIPTAAGP